MDVFIASRAGGKTSLCVDRLIAFPRAVMLVHDEQRKQHVLRVLRSRIVEGRGAEATPESLGRLEEVALRVLTLAQWKSGQHLGRPADPLLVDDMDDILMSLLGCYVALGTMTGRT